MLLQTFLELLRCLRCFVLGRAIGLTTSNRGLCGLLDGRRSVE